MTTFADFVLDAQPQWARTGEARAGGVLPVGILGLLL
jgi:hypothetical protein